MNKYLLILLCFIFTTTAFAQTGNVGIGTTDPDSKLHVETSTSDGTEAEGFKLTNGGWNSLFYHNDGDLILRKMNQTNQLVLDTDGGVGIGTNVPDYQLDVRGPAIIGDGTGGNNQLYIRRANGGANIMGILANSSHEIVLFNRTGGGGGNLLLTTQYGNIIFGDNAGDEATITNEVMRVNTDNGRVGIGTDAPAQKLHVDEGQIRATTTAGGTYTLFYGLNTSGEARGLIAGSQESYWTSSITGVYGYSAGITNNLDYVVNANGTMDGNDILKFWWTGSTGGKAGDFEINDSKAWKPGGGSWTATSDKRLKKDITSYGDGLETLLKINTVKYKYNGLGGINTGEEEFIGVIAQEVKEVAPYMTIPYSIKMNEDDEQESEVLAVDPSAFTYMLINAVQEQNKLMEAKDAEIAALKAEVEAMKQESKELSADVEMLKNEFLKMKTGNSTVKK